MAIESNRLDELLVTGATEGLGASQEDELKELLVGRPGIDAEAFERAAAAVHLATIEPDAALPNSLREKLDRDATRYFSAQADAPASNVVRLDSRAVPKSGPTGWPWLATAAAVLLAIAGWWPDTEPSAPALAEQRATLIERDAIIVEWMATEDPSAADASGNVVWSQAEQRGFMLFRGLQANQPRSFQYQLWIFDAERDERFPVDGGVFDIQAGAEEVIIPFSPNIPVGDAVLFAITLEAPGGVVVSSRERIAVVAEPA